MDAPQPKPKPKEPDPLLRVKLDRLLRVKAELWEECQPIPAELEAKILEIRKSLGERS